MNEFDAIYGSTYVDAAVQLGVTYSYYVKSVTSSGYPGDPFNTVESSVP